MTYSPKGPAMPATDLAAVHFDDVAASHPDPAFPHFHPRPARGWINDPNGISFINGRYHVFFQYNPDSARHHKIAWGHVSSADLVRWEEHPVALRPQHGGPDEYGCWTGVVTDDGGVPTAAYSGVRGDGGHSQVVIARGSQDLVHWEQTGHVAATMPTDGQVTAVRDPFIFRFNGKRYAMRPGDLSDRRTFHVKCDGAGQAADVLFVHCSANHRRQRHHRSASNGQPDCGGRRLHRAQDGVVARHRCFGLSPRSVECSRYDARRHDHVPDRRRRHECAGKSGGDRQSRGVPMEDSTRRRGRRLRSNACRNKPIGPTALPACETAHPVDLDASLDRHGLPHGR